MARTVKRICYVCRKEYEYCHRCSDGPTWHYAFCDENCKDLSKILDDYTAGITTANDANKLLEKIDLSNLDNFAEFAKNEIEEIKANSKPKTTKAKNDADEVLVKKPKKTSVFADSE